MITDKAARIVMLVIIAIGKTVRGVIEEVGVDIPEVEAGVVVTTKADRKVEKTHRNKNLR